MQPMLWLWIAVAVIVAVWLVWRWMDPKRQAARAETRYWRKLYTQAKVRAIQQQVKQQQQDAHEPGARLERESPGSLVQASRVAAVRTPAPLDAIPPRPTEVSDGRAILNHP
jgi:hypothetical protein